MITVASPMSRSYFVAYYLSASSWHSPIKRIFLIKWFFCRFFFSFSVVPFSHFFLCFPVVVYLPHFFFLKFATDHILPLSKCQFPGITSAFTTHAQSSCSTKTRRYHFDFLDPGPFFLTIMVRSFYCFCKNVACVISEPSSCINSPTAKRSG